MPCSQFYVRRLGEGLPLLKSLKPYATIPPVSNNYSHPGLWETSIQQMLTDLKLNLHPFWRGGDYFLKWELHQSLPSNVRQTVNWKSVSSRSAVSKLWVGTHEVGRQLISGGSG